MSAIYLLACPIDMNQHPHHLLQCLYDLGFLGYLNPILEVPWGVTGTWATADARFRFLHSATLATKLIHHIFVLFGQNSHAFLFQQPPQGVQRIATYQR